MTQFFTNEAVSLEKRIVTTTKLVPLTDEEVDEQYEIGECIQWIRKGEFKKVCLQFPDFLLPDSTRVAIKLQEELQQTVYVLGDTAYESCCLDYVAAAHVEANAIIHFGPKCFSKPTDEIASLFIYEKHKLDVEKLATELSTKFTDDNCLIVLDNPYIHLKEQIATVVPSFSVIGIDSKINTDVQNVIYIGKNGRKLMNFNLIYRPKQLYFYDDDLKSLHNYEGDTRVLKRRYFLIEKIKDSQTVGIIVGTLAVKNYLRVIERVKRLMQLHRKKYYLISVGKPTVAKLANFPEMDVYVLISCAMNEIYDSRDFCKPIVSPHDVETALNPNAGNSNFSYAFADVEGNNADLDLLEGSEVLERCDVSLLSGRMRGACNGVDEDRGSGDGVVAVRMQGTVAVSGAHGAGFLAERSWKGLEQELGRTEPALAVEGRRGIAQGYCNERE